MSYVNYLKRYKRWLNKGATGNFIDDNVSKDSSDHNSDDDDEDKEKEETKGKTQVDLSPGLHTPHHFDVSSDYRKYIPGEGSGKEFLKQEIDKMVDILRKKHEIGLGVHMFKKLELKGVP